MIREKALELTKSAEYDKYVASTLVACFLYILEIKIQNVSCNKFYSLIKLFSFIIQMITKFLRN